MNLTLEVVSPNGESLGPGRRKVFGMEGGRIGRAPDCEWVLPSPYVSRHHATIRWISDTYYIESTGENGVAVNSQQAMLPQLERRALKNGDRLFIDEYEIAVGLGNVAAEGAQPATGAASSSAFAPGNDPFAETLAPMRSQPPLVDPLEPAAEDLDPLQQLSGRHQVPPVTPPRQDASWNHTPGMSDHFTPPPVPPSSQAIPEDWDKTSFGRNKPAAPRPMDSPPPPSRPGGGGTSGGIPDDWDKTSFGRGNFGSPPPAPPSAPPRQPRVSVSVGLSTRPAPAPPVSASGVGTAPSPPPAAVPPTRQSAPPPRPVAPAPRQVTPTQTAGQMGGFDVAAFLHAAGVDPAAVPPETAASLGRILRSVVQGIIEVLQARAEIKNQFRLPLTRVKVAENNPLKFAVNAEDALNSLLGRCNPAYLPPVKAFEDALDDIRFHQMAMLAGMRAGFEHVMSRFDPERLLQVFEGHLKRAGGLLPMSSKSRYWEMYVEEYQDLESDRDEAFRRLFGEEFAAAYEKQLGVLKQSRSKSGR